MRLAELRALALAVPEWDEVAVAGWLKDRGWISFDFIAACSPERILALTEAVAALEIIAAGQWNAGGDISMSAPKFARRALAAFTDECLHSSPGHDSDDSAGQ